MLIIEEGTSAQVL